MEIFNSRQGRFSADRCDFFHPAKAVLAPPGLTDDGRSRADQQRFADIVVSGCVGDLLLVPLLGRLFASCRLSCRRFFGESAIAGRPWLPYVFEGKTAHTPGRPLIDNGLLSA